jgi:GT2 family glycosyltransferase
MPFSDPDVGCVAGEIWILNKGGALASYLAAKGYLSQADNFKHPFLPYAGGANLAFRRTILERIGLFDERLFSGHDADICWRMQLEAGAKIVLARDAIVSHSQDPSWRALMRQKRRHAHGAVLLYKKYRQYRGNERRSLKQTYWEYKSIFKRATSIAWKSSLARLRNTRFTFSDEEYQLLLEIAEKVGRVEGSLRRCVWYP